MGGAMPSRRAPCPLPRALGRHTANHAVDGLEATRWLCAADDAQPTLTLELRSTLRANTVLLSPAASALSERGSFDAITRVEISINDGEELHTVDLDGDELACTVVVLNRQRRIDTLVVRVLARRPAAAEPGRAGFAEVALELR